MENTDNLPRHIAIIPDGNRRWARRKTLAAWMGHKEGSKGLEGLLEVLLKHNIPYFSFWGSSRGNLTKRSKEEVSYLLQIYKEEFGKLADSEKVHNNRIKIRVFGAWQEMLPEDTKKEIERAIEKTKDYDKFFFNFFIAYSGTEEILNATEKIAEMKKSEPDLVVTEDLFKSQLWTRDLPQVDLLIRTGGEPHNSEGFMMWDVADSQLIFSDKLWPDYTNQDLENAIEEYSCRERRLGK